MIAHQSLRRRWCVVRSPWCVVRCPWRASADNRTSKTSRRNGGPAPFVRQLDCSRRPHGSRRSAVSPTRYSPDIVSTAQPQPGAKVASWHRSRQLHPLRADHDAIPMIAAQRDIGTNRRAGEVVGGRGPWWPGHRASSGRGWWSWSGSRYDGEDDETHHPARETYALGRVEFARTADWS